ncbi:MAG: selenide, water dikinase SelD [Acidobacteria bacterium]|nr:MAG: selenide, water dikinase SelD [Acidobacteriota bacterium]
MLGVLPVSSDARVLVDWRTADDAGVYRFENGRALVQTVDFFTPIVDDPIAYGRIAAANALSDVYAMGGRPLTALAIAGFPKELERERLIDIFKGGLETLQSAGVALLGGHTVQDPEIKFGYAVTGEVDPKRMWTNGGAQVGDRLLLTKPLGTGIIATAIKFDRAPVSAAAAAIASMTTVNRGAAEALRALPDGSVHACTDITGFGLIGHATEMARASRRTLDIDVRSVPLFEAALDLVEENTPGGGRTNQKHFESGVVIDSDLDPLRIQVLYDPQTSGGLLVAISEDAVAGAIRALRSAGVRAHLIGTVMIERPEAIRLH